MRNVMTESEENKVPVETTASAVDENTNPERENGKGRKVGKWLVPLITWLFRFLLGGTFIFSGVVKAIDPWGTVYKLHDYVSAMPDGLFSWMLPLLTPVTFVLFTVEILLGISLFTGSYRRLAPVGSVLMMLIMLPLTLWIALKDPVSDCGCFGDAWILTNWETFWKNVFLTGMSVWLLIFNKRSRCLILPAIQWFTVAAVIAFSIIIGFIGYSVQPMIDFRPYPVGGMLVENTDTREPAEEEIMAVWTNGKENITIPADSIPDSGEWEFVDRVAAAASASDADKKNETKEKGLAIYDGPEDITEEIISADGEQVVVFMTSLPDISSGNFYKLNSLYTYCMKHDISMCAVVAATPLQINDYIDHSLAEYPIYTAEDTAIKEVVRGNPAVVYLKNGKIVWKNSLSAIPTYDFMDAETDKPGILNQYAPFADKNVFNTLCLILFAFVALLAILSHVPKVISFTARRIRKSRWVKDNNVVVKVMFPLLFVVSLMSSCSDNDEPLPQPEQSKRTVLVYMVATNSLHADSGDDIREILEGYESLDKPVGNVLIYQAIPGDEGPHLYKVRKDKKGKAHLETLCAYSPESSSLTRARIRQVINDMKSYSPAEEYGLFLWSHASGWLPTGTPAEQAPVYRSFGDDFGKSISVTALAEALPKDIFRFIWMDCCYMGNIEVAYQLRDHCDTFVSYPTEILAGGAPYDKVIPCILGPEFSLENAAEATYDYYAENADIRYRSCTVSITDMKSLNELASVARQIVLSGNPLVSSSGIQTYGRLQNAYFYDLTQSFSAMAMGDEEQIKRFSETMDHVVTLKYATPKFLSITINPEHFSGLSCNLPSAVISNNFSEYYETLDWYRDVYL